MNNTFSRSDCEVTEDQPGEMSVDEILIDKESPPNFVTQRKVRTDMRDLRDELKSYQEGMAATLERWFVKQDEKFSKFINDFSDLKSSIKFMNDNYEELKLKTEDVSKRITTLEKRSSDILNNSSQVVELEARLDIMEQQSRQCNIEISNLPEKRGENLTAILEDVAALIKNPMTRQDVVAIHRVPQANTNSQRPKNIVVRFANRMYRDSFVAAVRLHKGLTSDQLRITGPLHKVYINEHLTLKNKALFRQTREAAKQSGFRFVWIKHGSILVRKNETSPVFAVRGQKDLAKISPDVK